MAFLVVDFAVANHFDFLVAPLSVIYIGILGLYVSTKEFDRWYDLYHGRHPGEIFVIAWTIVVFGLIIASVILRDGRRVSSEAIADYIMVLSVFALTQKSKSLYERKHKKKRH